MGGWGVSAKGAPPGPGGMARAGNTRACTRPVGTNPLGAFYSQTQAKVINHDIVVVACGQTGIV